LYRADANGPVTTVDPTGLIGIALDDGEGTVGVTPWVPHIGTITLKPKPTLGDFYDDLTTVGPAGTTAIVAETLGERLVGIVTYDPIQHIDTAIDKFHEYLALGLDPADALGFTLATEVPVVNAVTNGAEMIAGVSIEPGDFGQSLNWEDYFRRGANVTVTVAGIAEAAKGSSTRKKCPEPAPKAEPMPGAEMRSRGPRGGSGRNEPHGRSPGTRLLEQLQKYEEELAELKRTQGSAREKARIINKIHNLNKQIDKIIKGETHHMRR